MEDFPRDVPPTGPSLLGRRVIVVLPVFIILMAIILGFVALPSKYFFSVDNGKLCLMTGKIPWFDTRCSKVLEPLPIGDMDTTELTSRKFESEGDALAILKDFFSKRIQDQQEKVFELEKPLVTAYTALLTDMKGARAAGMQGYDRNIATLEGWFANHNRMAEAKEYSIKATKHAEEASPAEIHEEESHGHHK